MFECNEYAVVGDKRAWLSPAGDGTFTVNVGAPKEPLASYLHRRTERVNKEWWEKNFAPTADQFNEQQKIDTTRPKATKPVHWIHTLDLAPVLAQAKKENKPVLIDFETDWCVWCKRFDFFTYPYADVADQLGNFITVKFNCELDTNDVAKKYGVRGFPSLAVLAPDGRPLVFEATNPRTEEKTTSTSKSGFMAPAKMVPFLEECLARVSKGEIEPASARKDDAGGMDAEGAGKARPEEKPEEKKGK
jgi:thiol-disulfide isomerase/thioredoxin